MSDIKDKLAEEILHSIDVKYINAYYETITPRVVHCKKDIFDVYIGRPSKWGNPFVMGKDGTREEVVRKYVLWLIKDEQRELLFSIKELRGKTIACWCSPQLCHGDVLSELAIMSDKQLEEFIRLNNEQVE